MQAQMVIKKMTEMCELQESPTNNNDPDLTDSARDQENNLEVRTNVPLIETNQLSPITPPT